MDAILATPRVGRQAWLPIRHLNARFATNIEALSTRYPQMVDALRTLIPTQSYFILAANDRLSLGVASAGGVRALQPTLAAAAAREILKKCYPGNACDRPIVVAGEDLGWLWHFLYELPCNTPVAIGHRPPLYFLIRDLERLWVILHVKDWRQMLADPRVQLFAGADAFAEFQASLLIRVACPWPKLSVGLDLLLWPADLTVNSLTQLLMPEMVRRLSPAQNDLAAHASQFTPAFIAQRFRSGEPLNVLGITSRYTTFLQHSMRDWLDGFARLGHRTEMMIESADHEVPCTLLVTELCAKFKPDLIVMIDHCRAEMSGLPEGIPTVMWVQDCMPGIYSPAAGAAQAPTDYVLGFAYEKLRLVHEMGYPAERYLPTTIGMNPHRFVPCPADDPRLARYAGDVSLVTHASIPAEQLLQNEIDKNSLPAVKRLLSVIFDQLRAIYGSGGAVVAPAAMRRLVGDGLLHCEIKPNPKAIDQLMNLFYGSINNALFRHQTLRWLVELGIEPRLYGRGWENNKAFAKFARGVADNQNELSLIYQASRINLHVSPTGSLHQRVMEGLASGGFFLLRRGDGDIIGRHYDSLYKHCQKLGITTDDELKECGNPHVQCTLRQVIEIHHCDPFAEKYSFMQLLRTMHESDYLCSAGCVWGQDFDQTSFASKAELASKLDHFLNHPDDRQRLTRSMVQPVLQRFTYEKTSSRLLSLIAENQMAMPVESA